jgi:hypothetical protein
MRALPLSLEPEALSVAVEGLAGQAKGQNHQNQTLTAQQKGQMA